MSASRTISSRLMAWLSAAAAAVLLWLNVAGFAIAQKERQELLPPPRLEIENLAESLSVLPSVNEEYPIDLVSAVRLAETANPQIGKGRQVIEAAVAEQLRANALLLPHLRVGMNYRYHQGVLQTSFGEIRDVNLQSLYFGGGAKTLAAESVAFPAVQIFTPLADACFEPLVSRQLVGVRASQSQALTNDILRQVALAFLQLERAEARVTSIKVSEGDLHQVVTITAQFAKAGQGRLADANRARTESLLLHAVEQEAEEDVGVSGARLSRLLHLDPSVRLRHPGAMGGMLQLVDPDKGFEPLVHAAMAQRPELAAIGQEIARREIQMRQEKVRPLLPTVWIGFSAGMFGGATNRTDLVPVNNNWNNFHGRTDADARLWWTLENMGAGNIARRNERVAQRELASADYSRMVNQIRREVASSLAGVLAQRQQLAIAEDQLQRAEAGFAEDLLRSRGNLGLPIEVLDNMRRLTQARLNLIEVVISYNMAQVDLYVALGLPPLPALQQLQCEPQASGTINK